MSLEEEDFASILWLESLIIYALTVLIYVKPVFGYRKMLSFKGARLIGA